MDRTPHPEEPAEGAAGGGDSLGHRTPHPEEPAEGSGDATRGGHTGDPEEIPEHNSAPDGVPGESGEPGERQDSPLGGDETTEEQLDSDNAVEDDTLKTLDPDDPPA